MASMHFDTSATSCFFFAFVLPLGRPPTRYIWVTVMSSDSDVVSESLDGEDSYVTEIVNLFSLSTNSSLSSTNALDTLFFRALWVISILFAHNDAIT